jgi:transcriptional regulator with XRE-family HTH domain
VSKNKLIAARKEKNMTQNDMAELLFMDQSQYQRREQGKIHISNDEWDRMAKLLDKEVEDIKEEETIATINNNYDNYSGNYAAGDNNFYNIPEFMMKYQQEYIEMLKEENRRLKEEMEKSWKN